MSRLDEILARVDNYRKAIKEENEALNSEVVIGLLDQFSAKTDKAGNNFYSHAPDDVLYLLGELEMIRSASVKMSAPTEDKTYKLYVWEDALCDYTCGIIFAYATSLEEARQQVLAKDNSRSIQIELRYDPKEYENEPVTFIVSGGG